MFGILIYGLFFLIPVVLLVLFGIFLHRYLAAKRENRKFPGTYSDAEIRRRGNAVVIMAIIAGTLIAVVAGFVALFFMAIAFM
jgi:ABC-type Fe3+ transport system permease subunit